MPERNGPASLTQPGHSLAVRGTGVNNADPLHLGRLQAPVPDVGGGNTSGLALQSAD